MDMRLSRWIDDAGTHGGFCLIAGTTASGKSALACTLAERTGGVVVNADSVQLHRSLPILTAQPTATDRSRAEHRLYGILDDHDNSSVARWLELATATIAEIQPRLAVVTGGTGFYLDALLNGVPTAPATPADLRAASTARLRELGVGGFARELEASDPRLAARGLPHDPQRLLRAWEVLQLTGRSIASFWEHPRERPPLPAYRGGVALVPPPAETATRIENRLDAMLAAGLLAELAAFLERPAARLSPLAKADGVREFAGYLQGPTSLAAARAATIVKVRRYAKRQRTWLRHRLNEVEVLARTGDALCAEL